MLNEQERRIGYAVVEDNNERLFNNLEDAKKYRLVLKTQGKLAIIVEKVAVININITNKIICC